METPAVLRGSSKGFESLRERNYMHEYLYISEGYKSFVLEISFVHSSQPSEQFPFLQSKISLIFVLA